MVENNRLRIRKKHIMDLHDPNYGWTNLMQEVGDLVTPQARDSPYFSPLDLRSPTDVRTEGSTMVGFPVVGVSALRRRRTWLLSLSDLLPSSLA